MREIIVRFNYLTYMWPTKKTKNQNLWLLCHFVKTIMMNAVIAEWFLITDLVVLSDLHIKVTEIGSEEQFQNKIDQMMPLNDN